MWSLSNWLMIGLMAIVPVSVYGVLRVRDNPALLTEGAETIQRNLGLPTVTELKETVTEVAKKTLDNAFVLMCLVGLAGLVAFLTNPILGVAVAGIAGIYMLRQWMNSPDVGR